MDNSNFLWFDKCDDEVNPDDQLIRKSVSSKGQRPHPSSATKQNWPKSSWGNRSFDITHTKTTVQTMSGKWVSKKNKASIGFGNSWNKEGILTT